MSSTAQEKKPGIQLIALDKPLLADAILNSDFIALVIIEDDHIVWANAAMHGILGYEAGELIGLPSRNLFINQESYAAFVQEAYPVIAAGGTYCKTLPQKQKDGAVGWYEVSFSSLAGYPNRVVGAIVDSTSSNLAIASKSLYQSVLEDQTEVISRFSPDGTFVFVNEVYCRVFGKTTAELIGHRWQPAAHPDDLAMIEARLRQMSSLHPVVTIENRVFVAGGALCWMQFVNRGIYDDQGNLMEIQAVGRDITYLKQIESNLRESDERLELALEGSGLVLWDWNIPEHKVTVGKRWFELLGYQTEDPWIDEDSWIDLINPKDLSHFKLKMSAHLQGETPGFESEHQLRHQQGHWLSVELKGKVTLRDQAYQPLRMVGTILDITQRKRLNDEGIDLLNRIEALIRESSSRSPVTPAEVKSAESLTKRERQILGMIAIGMTSTEIGEKLHLSTPTVISHRRNMMAKLDLHSTAEVTHFAIKHGLVASK